MLPNPILEFTLFGKEVQVFMYGVCIAIGLLACFGVLVLYSKKRKMPYEILEFIFFTAIFAIAFGFLFAKLYQAVYNWIEDGYFDFMSAGITVMGGLIGGAATFLAIYFGVGHFVFNKGKKKNLHLKHFNTIFCLAPICISIAHAFGRIGCLMAGCCYGREVDSGFRIYNHGAYRIPAQLYEALFLFALFAVLSILYFKRYNFIMHVYLIAYAIWRFIIEIFRDDSRGATVLGLEPSQWQSIVFIVIGLALTAFYYFRKIPWRLPESQFLEDIEE
jgi:phosphatidylglycerol:prolipoprotein diacylglycerol transferase